MYCPFCHSENTKVIDTRLTSEGENVKRRRECLDCEQRFTTIEKPVLVMPNVIKRDGTREQFNEEKLRKGMKHALEKRPVSTEKVDDAISRIIVKIRNTCERELQASTIGQFVMDELRELDLVAYIRFASVYSSFENIQDFARVINLISEEEELKTKQ
jgi:transcriptional repressor NrdR